ncbi:MAG: DUF1963 domain-containing protein [Bacteroidales bacterium]|nr:DUF1963 domain-containing protein [Bacteroidales bacterium]
MSIIGNVISKLLGNKKAQTQDEVKQFDCDEIIKRISEQIAPNPMVSLNIKKTTDDVSVFDSKIGGRPYLPKDFAYPCVGEGHFAGEQLHFLAQINFAQMPNIEPFPKEGILQFYICGNPENYSYGCEYGNDNAAKGNEFRVVFHKDICTDETQLMDANDMPKWAEDEDFPAMGIFAIEAGGVSDCPLSVQDFRFDEVLAKVVKELYGTEIETINDLGSSIRKRLQKKLKAEGSHIGGYPFFCQEDVRKTNFEKHTTLLFQLDSHQNENGEYDIMWGDMGVANFFIEPNAMKNLDFTNVLFNWDCY